MGANNPERLFQKGDVAGTQLVLSPRGNQPCAGGQSQFSYMCQCTRCGYVARKSEPALVSYVETDSKSCGHCICVGNHCPECYDLPHRRPQSKPCKCGKRYEPDTFEATELDAHACADLWLYAARELGPDSFAGIVDWL